MASRPVPAQYLTAGQEYLDALVALGLIPAFLGWGWDPAEKQWLLVLVTSIVDAGGPLALNRLLFRAYNAKATPKQISPFLVRVFSPDLIPGGVRSEFWLLGKKDLTLSTIPSGIGPGIKVQTTADVKNFRYTFMGLELEMINSYQTLPGALKKARAGYHERQREWQRFRRQVEALAA